MVKFSSHLTRLNSSSSLGSTSAGRISHSVLAQSYDTHTHLDPSLDFLIKEHITSLQSKLHGSSLTEQAAEITQKTVVLCSQRPRIAPTDHLRSARTASANNLRLELLDVHTLARNRMYIARPQRQIVPQQLHDSSGILVPESREDLVTSLSAFCTTSFQKPELKHLSEADTDPFKNTNHRPAYPSWGWRRRRLPSLADRHAPRCSTLRSRTRSSLAPAPAGSGGSR